MLTPTTQTGERHSTDSESQARSLRNRFRGGPANTLIVALITCTVLACLTTAYELVIEYRDSTAEIGAQHDAILHLDTLPLIHSIIEGESDHTQKLVEIIAEKQTVDEVILEQLGQNTLTAGVSVTAPLRESVFPLISGDSPKDGIQAIGTLTLRTDAKAFQQRFNASIGPRLLTNFIRMLAMAAIVALLYHHFFGRHLHALSIAFGPTRQDHKRAALTLPRTRFYAPPSGISALASALSKNKTEVARERRLLEARYTELETENAALREQLRGQTALARLGTQAGAVIHEVRSPLGAIQAASRLLVLKLADAQPAVKEALYRVESNTLRLDHLLRLSRDMATGTTTAGERVELGAWVERFINAATLPADFELRFASARNALYADVDPLKVEQILKNLIDNAVQAVHGRLESNEPQPPRARVIDVQLTAIDCDTAGIYITDRGGGLQPEASGRLFDPLFTTKPDGMGMGLPISVRLAKLLGGSLTLTSTKHGTTACLTLPRCAHSNG